MIDWLVIRFPCHAAATLRGDSIVRVDADGAVLYSVKPCQLVRGSYSEGINCRPVKLTRKGLRDSELREARRWKYGVDRVIEAASQRSFYDGVGLEIAGCPPKFLQGHNCFGDDDLRAYALALVDDVLPRIGVELWPEERAEIAAGKFGVLRVDITQMRALSSAAAVNAVIRGCEYGAALRRRGHGQVYGGGESVLFGAGSRRWSVMMYAKAVEMRKHPPKLSDGETDLLLDYAKSALRIELRLWSLELSRKGLEYGFAWEPDTAIRLYNEYIAAVNISGEVVMPENILAQLRPTLRGVYTAWRDGEDLRATMTKPTFYRHRAALLKFGIDIATKQPKAAKNNVVPLRSVFEAVPLGVPEWARGTPLYFDTSKVKREA